MIIDDDHRRLGKFLYTFVAEQYADDMVAATKRRLVLGWSAALPDALGEWASRCRLFQAGQYDIGMDPFVSP